MDYLYANRCQTQQTSFKLLYIFETFNIQSSLNLTSINPFNKQWNQMKCKLSEWVNDRYADNYAKKYTFNLSQLLVFCVNAFLQLAQYVKRKRDTKEMTQRRLSLKGKGKKINKWGEKRKNIKEKTESKIQPTAGTQRLMMNMYSNKVPHAANRGPI